LKPSIINLKMSDLWKEKMDVWWDLVKKDEVCCSSGFRNLLYSLNGIFCCVIPFLQENSIVTANTECIQIYKI